MKAADRFDHYLAHLRTCAKGLITLTDTQDFGATAPA